MRALSFVPRFDHDHVGCACPAALRNTGDWLQTGNMECALGLRTIYAHALL